MANEVARQKQLHKLRHVIMRLAEDAQTPELRALKQYGCVTWMHVMRLIAPPMAGEDHSKDIDFSSKGIHGRWDAGYADMKGRVGGRAMDSALRSP